MSTDDQTALLREERDGLAWLTINRPKRLNTLNRTLIRELRRTFLQLSENRDVRVIVLSAVGEKAFCAGADLKESDTHEYGGLSEFLAEQPGVWEMMMRCPQIIVSEVNGWAVGGGLQLALFSDLVYASVGASFRIPQVQLGLIPPYGTTVRLGRYIGQGRAMKMLLLGETMRAEQAYECGLVQGLAMDASALRDEVETVVQSLLRMPPESLALAKNSIITGWDMSAEGAAVADRFRSYALKQSTVTKQLHEQWRTGVG